MERGAPPNKFPILSLDASLLMRQKTEIINQVKLYYLRTYCFLVPRCCLLIIDQCLLLTVYSLLSQMGNLREAP